MPKYYLGGPMRGKPQWNFPAFFAAAELLRNAGTEIASPAEHDVELGFTDWATATEFKVPGYGIADAIRWDLSVLCDDDCRGIILLPGWETSQGAKLERQTVQFLGKKAYDFIPAPDRVLGFTLREQTLEAPAKLAPAPVAEVPQAKWDRAAHEAARGPQYGDRAEPQEKLPAGEVRTRNETTGGEKGQKLARFDLVPTRGEWQVAELYGIGALKYAERNWELGYDWSLSYAAMMRHAKLFWKGEEYDVELYEKFGVKLSHLACVIFHCNALIEFAETHPELDNRPKGA